MITRVFQSAAILAAMGIAGWVGWSLDFQEPAATTRQAEAAASARQVIQAPVPQHLGLGLTVEEAYAAIPHARTPFAAGRSSLPPQDRAVLAALFAWTDLATVERVVRQRRLNSGVATGALASNYETILSGLSSLEVPSHLREPAALVIEAVSDQRRFMELWEASRARRFNPKHGLVASSHRKLIAVYSRLMEIYGGETDHNKKAFFDHLCALDFI